jgi:hypothetical protein
MMKMTIKKYEAIGLNWQHEAAEIKFSNDALKLYRASLPAEHEAHIVTLKKAIAA